MYFYPWLCCWCGNLQNNHKGLNPQNGNSPLLFQLKKFHRTAILKNKLCDELRKRMYMSDTAIEDVNAVAPTDVEDDYMEEEQRKNEFSLVKRLLDQLSPRQREALTLYYIEEKKYEDICEIMNMNYQSVRNLMHRGLTKLRSLAS